ncbi:molybdenum cofactor guanylyltransferase [Nostocoides sp. HKS02]|uniref:molybdenum cofactor guanylyltransferase n=1 Tax=Nostocoides sp. HKS02 TaxID=1813880 RepID=UPI0012B44E58|nr:NTP transferase domain-containing protein [Tetrasphaera sp. HKS02]QGN58716.1 NTP transferase domain-containing protein [Tetrasphaera sp. HKS02]
MTTHHAPAVTVVVLCGGSARRFGSDKTRADLAGTTVLDRLLGGLPGHWPVICVGAPRPVPREVTWCQEHPPGGGPLAALAASLPGVSSPVLVLLGGDMPYAAHAAPSLVSALDLAPDADAAVGRDGAGRSQPLLAAYRTAALAGALPNDPVGMPLMRLLDTLRVLDVPVDPVAALDVDTPEDLERARHRLEG